MIAKANNAKANSTKTKTAKPTAAKTGNKAGMNLTTQLPARSAVWAALEKIAGKQKNSDEIADGSRHVVNLDIAGMIDGQLFTQSVDSIVSVGHRQTRSSSVTPAVLELLAYILGKLNRATRERILADAPVEFAANDCNLPATDEGLVEQVKRVLAQLRRTRTVQARGAIKCEFMFSS